MIKWVLGMKKGYLVIFVLFVSAALLMTASFFTGGLNAGKCPDGQTWIPRHRAGGHWVPGHCKPADEPTEKKCPEGEAWVPRHMWQNQWVPGHCRPLGKTCPDGSFWEGGSCKPI